MSNSASSSKQSNRCRAKAKSGKPCRAASCKGGLCFFHGNPKLASELGRKGGSRRKRQPPSEGMLTSWPAALSNVAAICEFTDQLIEKASIGQLDSQRARDIVLLLRLKLQLLEFNPQESTEAPLEPGATFFEVIEADWLKEKKEELRKRVEKKYADRFPKGDKEDDENKDK